MQLIAKLDEFETFSSGRQRLGVFLCPFCSDKVKRTLSHGKRDKSCGCQRNKTVLNGRWKGGISKHPLYFVHASIVQRCTNPNSEDWPCYGGRGIVLCPEWTSPSTFIAWAKANGWKPGLTIDRIENDHGYSPGNCRFITNELNTQNSRRAKIDLPTARAIKHSISEGHSTKKIARIHNTTIHIVADIRRNRTWKNA